MNGAGVATDDAHGVLIGGIGCLPIIHGVLLQALREVLVLVVRAVVVRFHACLQVLLR